MSLPLNGIKVLDVSNVLAGPFCGYQLAALGAEVIKIEQPGEGDLARHLGADPNAAAARMGASFVAVNAGKQSVTVNLKDERGKELFRRLVGETDVVLENFRPGVMTRLGVDYDMLSQINPGLVYCAISGFGADSPLAQRPAYDQIIQGLSGVMAVTGDSQTAPLRVGFPVCDTIGGLTAAFAICAALIEAKSTGKGRYIDVSMLDSTLATMGWVVSNYLNAGIAPTPMGNQNFTAAPSGTFRTKDGLLNIAANESKQYRALCDLIGRPDLLTDPRFAERQQRKQNREQLNVQVERALAGKTAAEWETLMTAKGIPAGRVLKVPDVLTQPHIAHRRFLVEFEKDGRSQRVTRPGFRLSADEAGPQGPAPALSEHTDFWLKKLGYDDEQVSRLHEDGVV